MNNLSNIIYRYYLDHLSLFDKSKQFHFASRLYLWQQLPETRPILDELYFHFNAQGNLSQALVKAGQEIKQTYQSQAIWGTRLAKFSAYERLQTILGAMFRALFLKTVYGVDARSVFWQLFREDELTALKNDLLKDPSVLITLSSDAINFLFLYHWITDTEAEWRPQQFLTIGRIPQVTADGSTLQSLFYLYTHCIINDSLFYYRALSPTHLTVYTSMLTALDKLLDNHFDRIKLDLKFEFLVCARLANFSSPLAHAIQAEAEQSVSPAGSFLIDRRNFRQGQTSTSLRRSEHRNVLFLMSQLDFQPLGS